MKLALEVAGFHDIKLPPFWSIFCPTGFPRKTTLKEEVQERKRQLGFGT
jgi:hypothetical protein